MLNVWRALRFTVISVILLGLLYPLGMTLVGQVAFPFQAQGSLAKHDGQVVGSYLIAQKTTARDLFDPRPSFVSYNAMGSGGSNYGPTNPALQAEVKHNLTQALRQNPGVTAREVPTSMVESSGSGLDPDITVQDAWLQIPRVARATGLSVATVRGLVSHMETPRSFGLWGEPMVNVLRLNLAVEAHIGH